MIKKLFCSSGEFFATVKYSSKVYCNYKKHMHPVLSFGVIEEGSMQIEFENSKVILQKDSLVAFNKFKLHHSKNIDAKGYYSIYISQEWLKKRFKNIDCLDLIEYKNISSLIKNALMQNNCDELSLIFEKIIKDNSVNNTNKSCEVVDSMIEHIYNNINDKISIDSIAKELQFSKEYLIRKFKKQMGLTPQQFILSLKVHLSSVMLLNNNSNITDISYSYSFFDQSHYIKTFKDIYGISPKNYKKSIFYN